MRKERFYEPDFKGYLNDLINTGRLSDTEAGITKQVIDKGYDSLSEKQKFVFDRAISNNSIDECKTCGTDIPWSEMLNALDNGGLCSHCQHMWEKMERE